MGPVGSGKTTLARKLSKKYNIKNYNLDIVAHDNDNGGGKRDPKEAQKLLNDIIKKNKWIIEDTGRDVFIDGREKADTIYYLKISKIKAYYRVTKRLINQLLGRGEGHFKDPKLSLLPYYFTKVNNYFKREKELLKSLEKYQDKFIILSKKDIKKIKKNEVKYMKINLHTHSNYSLDGEFDVQYLIEFLKKNDFDIISITDHDTCEAYKHIENETNINIITGIEADAIINNHTYDFLCYNFKFEEVYNYTKEKYETIDKRQLKIFNALVQKAKDNNINLSNIDSYDSKKEYAHAALFRMLDKNFLEKYNIKREESFGQI